MGYEEVQQSILTGVVGLLKLPDEAQTTQSGGRCGYLELTSVSFR